MKSFQEFTENSPKISRPFFSPNLFRIIFPWFSVDVKNLVNCRRTHREFTENNFSQVMQKQLPELSSVSELFREF